MILTVEIPAAVEAGLAREAQVRGVAVPALAAQLIEEALGTSVREVHPRHSPLEIRAWLDSLAVFSDRIPPLSSESFSRNMIYRDHD